MTPDSVLSIFQHALEVVLIMIVVILIPALVVGLLVSMFQAATQINEMTLSFIPKLIATVLTLMLAGPWLLRLLIDYTQRLVHDIPYLIG
ncbi:MAG: flagellar biosynthesis protein FliQ [Thiohalophilus sp.]|uniref:flagellar biosynthesis protein FliQ n=1 Tax=Thiohalophilus sp. TaxID=3028392 RepID=UPI00287050C5|nr:flagellar biosynthesis protein FliQ [Thiohalophilus sp.]MDR9436658.1 flagellar biosynthesis protein FliQ [Thiohalophilus sp.]